MSTEVQSVVMMFPLLLGVYGVGCILGYRLGRCASNIKWLNACTKEIKVGAVVEVIDALDRVYTEAVG